MLLLLSSSYLYSWKCFIDDFSVHYSLKVVADILSGQTDFFICLFQVRGGFFLFLSKQSQELHPGIRDEDKINIFKEIMKLNKLEDGMRFSQVTTGIEL